MKNVYFARNKTKFLFKLKNAIKRKFKFNQISLDTQIPNSKFYTHMEIFICVNKEMKMH